METKNLQLLPIEIEGIRVLTTLQLAGAYCTTSRRISENFNRNSERFIEGVHYIRLTGEELRKFVRYANCVSQNTSKIRELYLWTERGALLHAKSLNTDKAWEVYEFLLENYFRVRQILTEQQNKLSIPDIAMLVDKVNSLSEEVATLTEKVDKLSKENKKLKQEIKESDKKFTDIIRLDKEDITKLQEKTTELSQKIYLLTKDKFKIGEQIKYLKDTDIRLDKKDSKINQKINALDKKFTDIIKLKSEELTALDMKVDDLNKD